MSEETNDQKTHEDSGSKTYKCAKCGKEKKESEGMFVYGGTTFCCENCCHKDKEKEKADNMCEFC